MPFSNRDRIDRELFRLRDALRAYVGDAAHAVLRPYFPWNKREFDKPISDWDVRMLLRAIRASWSDLNWSAVRRSQISELLTKANDFHHQADFDDGATRALCALVWQVIRQISPALGPAVERLFETQLEEAREYMSWQPTHTWYWDPDWLESWNDADIGWVLFVDDEHGDCGRREGVNLCIIAHDRPYDLGSTNPALVLAETLVGRAAYKNSLVFLALDDRYAKPLEEAIARRIAWEQVCAAVEGSRQYMPHERAGAQACLDQAVRDVETARREGYRWLLIPIQAAPERPVEWRRVELASSLDPVRQALRELANEGYTVTTLEPTRLAEAMDRMGGSDAKITELAEEFARCLALPRLKDWSTLSGAIEKGLRVGLFEYWFGVERPLFPHDFSGFRRNLFGFLAKPGAVLAGCSG